MISFPSVNLFLSGTNLQLHSEILQLSIGLAKIKDLQTRNATIKMHKPSIFPQLWGKEQVDSALDRESVSLMCFLMEFHQRPKWLPTMILTLIIIGDQILRSA